ncbi:hypothetical protein HRM2_18290 [Desulforapulum autotrophicum HRM2]|uniref:Uncharacterized protein n=1 Tax=Desulforapulum autotrophicum (strain ATCC 43914 / DSM 3382 / VKM B-1955 / HRM2) TaxID=177437 RepID=C0QBR9_DESAH|nr:hypothetical protein HRM2_18290 [Desulforapulum autotrophicum HRM2]
MGFICNTRQSIVNEGVSKFVEAEAIPRSGRAGYINLSRSHLLSNVLFFDFVAARSDAMFRSCRLLAHVQTFIVDRCFNFHESQVEKYKKKENTEDQFCWGSFNHYRRCTL